MSTFSRHDPIINLFPILSSIIKPIIVTYECILFLFVMCCILSFFIKPIIVTYECILFLFVMCCILSSIIKPIIVTYECILFLFVMCCILVAAEVGVAGRNCFHFLAICLFSTANMKVRLDNWHVGTGLFDHCKFIISRRVPLAEFLLPLLNCLLYCYLLIIIAPIIAMITIVTVSAFSHVHNLLFLLFPKFAINLIDYKLVMVNFYQYAIVTVYFVIYEIFYVSTRTLSFILRITTKLRYLDHTIILIISLFAYLPRNAQLDYFQCNIFTDNYFVLLISGDVHPSSRTLPRKFTKILSLEFRQCCC